MTPCVTPTAAQGAPVRRVMVMPLGDLAPERAREIVIRQLGLGADAQLSWADRNLLRGNPVVVLARVLRARARAGARLDDAVLVAPDLRQPRLRLTSLLLLALPRAQRVYRLDVLGRSEPFSIADHLARNGWPIVRHATALAVTSVVVGPMAAALGRRLTTVLPNSDSNSNSETHVRILYLRSQLWLGLSGGGSVAHTAGVINGLQAAGRALGLKVDVQVVSSDTLPGVTVPTTVVPPETWFDGRLRELEELVYTVPFASAAVCNARRSPLHVRARRTTNVLYQRHTTFNCSGAILKWLLGWRLILEFNSSEIWKGQYWGGLHHTALAEMVERINLAAADRVVVVSRVLERTLVAQGVPAAKILVNPNAVDPDLFGPHVDGTVVRQKLGFAPEDVVVGFSGTFGLWHGIPTLAATLAPLAGSRPQVRWLLIGDGPLRNLVDSAVQEHELTDRVRLPGLVPHARMPAYLAACDIVVSPHGRQADGSEFFGSPTKLFEYMAAGRPIVASAVGQIADVLEHERTALLVLPDDPTALADAITRLVDDADLRARLGDAARTAAVERHTWRQNAERVLTALKMN